MRQDSLIGLLGFVVSPPGLLVLVAVLFVLPLFVVYPIYWRRRTRKLARHFKGRLSYPGANLTFDYQGRPVRLSRQSVHRGRGSYPALTLGTSMRGKFFIANPEATRYVQLGWPTGRRETVVVASRTLWLGSTSESLLRNAAHDLETLQPGPLFDSQYASLRIPAMREYMSRTFAHGATASYWGVGEEVYDDPLLLEHALDRLCAILAWAEAAEGGAS